MYGLGKIFMKRNFDHELSVFAGSAKAKHEFEQIILSESKKSECLII